MKKPKVDMRGVEAANQAIAAAQLSAQNLQKNFQADLKNQEMAVITPGATAEEGPASTGLRRKRKGGGLASQLGVNV